MIAVPKLLKCFDCDATIGILSEVICYKKCKVFQKTLDYAVLRVKTPFLKRNVLWISSKHLWKIWSKCVNIQGYPQKCDYNADPKLLHHDDSDPESALNKWIRIIYNSLRNLLDLVFINKRSIYQKEWSRFFNSIRKIFNNFSFFLS